MPSWPFPMPLRFDLCGEKLSLEYWRDSPLHQAVLVRDLEQIRTVIQKGEWDPDGIVHGWTALQMACHLGYEEVVQMLLLYGASVNMVGGEPEHHVSPLYIACLAGYEGIVQILLTGGAKIDSGVYSSLAAASHQGSVQTVKMLLSHHDHRNRTEIDQSNKTDAHGDVLPLLVAIKQGHTEVLDVLVKSGVRINESEERTLLDLAIEVQSVDMCKILLEGGSASVLTRNSRPTGCTKCILPIHKAAMYGHAAIVDLFITHGSPVDVTDHDLCGKTPLLYAISATAADVMTMLINRGANLASLHPNFCGSPIPALWECLLTRNYTTQMVKILIQGGCDVDFYSPCHRSTPLGFALESGHETTAMILLESDCNRTVLKQGKLPPLRPEFTRTLQQLASSTLSLMQLCRRSIREQFGFTTMYAHKVEQLELPRELREFVAYRNIDVIV